VRTAFQSYLNRERHDRPAQTMQYGKTGDSAKIARFEI
jgi:hypothetical protein